MTFAPASWAVIAAVKPAAPAPITTTSDSSTACLAAAFGAAACVSPSLQEIFIS